MPIAPSPALTWDVAGRLVRAAGRDPASHTILQENLATELTQFKPDFVESLQGLPADKLLEGLNGSYANGPVHMALKISRDIRQQPYDDAAVFARLEALDAELKSTVAAIPTPSKFYISGSLQKGRFGARSDVDVLCQAPAAWMKEQRQHWHNEEDVSIQYMDMESAADQQTFVDAFAPTREVSAEEIQTPGFLAHLYQQGVERKGYRIENGHLQANSPTILREVETPPDAAKHIMWSLPMV